MTAIRLWKAVASVRLGPFTGLMLADRPPPGKRPSSQLSQRPDRSTEWFAHRLRQVAVDPFS